MSGSIDALVEALVTTRTYDLEQPRHAAAPTYSAHAPGFVYTLHRRHEAGLGRRTSASGRLVTAEHAGTHVDALCHQAEDLRLYGDIEVTSGNQTPEGFTELGIETVSPILRRGVLLDVAGHAGVPRLERGTVVSSRDLEGSAAEQGVALRAGDVVLVRTGAGGLWNQPDDYLEAPGMDGEAARWLADHEPFAVGADNVAWDAPGFEDPEVGSLPGHLLLIVRHGVHIIENLFLEELAADGVHEFAFVCLPLKLQGVTASPVRPVAIVPDSHGGSP